jgi:hypothetical protein
MQENAFDMADAEALYDGGRENPRREGPPEDLLELRIQAPDPQLLEVELLVLEQLGRHDTPLSLYRDSRPCIPAASLCKRRSM